MSDDYTLVKDFLKSYDIYVAKAKSVFAEAKCVDRFEDGDEDEELEIDNIVFDTESNRIIGSRITQEGDGHSLSEVVILPLSYLWDPLWKFADLKVFETKEKARIAQEEKLRLYAEAAERARYEALKAKYDT